MSCQLVGPTLEPTWQDKCVDVVEMSPLAKLWLITMRRLWNKTAISRLRRSSGMVSTIEAGSHPGESPDACLDSGHRVAAASLGCGLYADLGLAADHVESIRALLEISQAHRQPVPRAVFQNLDLVSKHLRAIQRGLEAGRPDEQSEPPLSSGQGLPACRESPRPRLQQVAFECRASPSDR